LWGLLLGREIDHRNGCTARVGTAANYREGLSAEEEEGRETKIVEDQGGRGGADGRKREDGTVGADDVRSGRRGCGTVAGGVECGRRGGLVVAGRGVGRGFVAVVGFAFLLCPIMFVLVHSAARPLWDELAVQVAVARHLG
jgi:hypothetical protein